jgi:hypothetical protein
MEVWWIKGDGSVQDAYWYDTSIQTKVFDAGYIGTGYAVGGPMKVVVNQNGDYSFSGSWHDSGADSYDLDLAMVLVTPSGDVKDN